MLYTGFGFASYLFCVIFAWACMIFLFGIQIRWRWKPLWPLLFIVSACCLLDLQHFAGWQWMQSRANVDSPGGLVGSEIIQLVVPYALGTVGAAILFGTIFIISGIYLFNFNPILTALGAFSFYRTWLEEREERRLAEAPAAGTARPRKPAHPQEDGGTPPQGRARAAAGTHRPCPARDHPPAGGRLRRAGTRA